MVRLSAAKWVTLIVVLGLSGLGSAVYFAVQFEKIFPVNGWFFGGFADFKSFWLAGQLMADGRFDVLFDQVAFNFARQTAFPFDHGHVWSYPIHVLLFTWPLSLIPYPLAASLWISAGGMCLVLLVRRTGPGWPLGLAIVLFSGSFFFWFYLGQLTPFIVVLLAGAAYCAPTRPALAGLCLGVMSIKPQLALLVGVLLLLTGQWRVIGAAAATALALVLASFAAFGAEPWIAFVRDALPAQQEVMFHWRPVQPLIATFQAAFYFTQGRPDWSVALQAGMSLAALASVVWVSRTPLPWERKASIALCATVAGLPYLLVYDHLLLVPALLPVLLNPRTGYPRFLIALLALSTSSIGVLVLLVGGVPFTPTVVAALLACEVWRARVDAARLTRTESGLDRNPAWA